jgi:hypothetical protein
MKLVRNLKSWIALTLAVSMSLWVVGCAKETTAPVAPVANGAPKKQPQAGSTAGPGAEVPEQTEATAKSDEKPAVEKPAEEKKSDDKPADDKPAEEKKSEEKKSDDKPADDKPAEEK